MCSDILKSTRNNMKKWLAFGLVFVWSFSAFSQKMWQKQGVKIDAPICYGSNQVNRTFVKPPDKLKSTSGKGADIIVVYDEGFEADPTAKNAFETAVSIWEGLIESPVPIYLYAYWSDLEDGVLGSCGPWDFYENLDFMPRKNTFYPVAMVEKMLGEEITDGATPDMKARFNRKNKSWYFGTDGNTPSNKYDFLSVVLHEIGHGLGYTGMAQADTINKTGSFYSYTGSKYEPGIFDQFIINSENKYLTNTALYKNPSLSLLKQLQSGYLSFKGQIPYDDGGVKSYPRIYAPSEWNDGSSIYHLNENSYQAGTDNSLMTPYFSRGEAIHNPGPMSLGMLFEMGWKFIRMKHEKHPDIEAANQLKPIDVNISSDYELDSTKLFLISSADNFVHADTILLKATAQSELFQANLSIQSEGTLKYYFSAKNKRNQLFRMPGIAPETSYSITYGKDLQAPVLTHQPIVFMKQEDLSAEIIVGATDNMGIGSVKVEYLVNNQAAKELSLSVSDKNIYKGTLSFPAGSLIDGDSIRYRIVATDLSQAKNQRVLPATGYYSFKIEGTYEPVSTYFSDFNQTNRDFLSADFSIKTPSFFLNGALHSLHPYKSPEKDDMSFEYQAQLKYPIILKSGGMISYDEVVLVEPADDGAVFGGDEFWDYVIVEGSKDRGKTWKALIDGYDSGTYKSWKSAYNSGIVGNNSTASGTKDLYLKREFAINQKGHFETGDTILIRFRLYSDPFANGWGWCIDNLSIQDPATVVATMEHSPGELIFFPNPVSDELIFRGDFSRETERLKLLIYNHSGSVLMQYDWPVSGNIIQQRIDMSALSAGIYLVVVEFENGERISRKIIKR